MNDTPKVSVIIPVYNSALFLDKAIKSVLNQPYDNLEIILVDDGSQDNSWKILEDWKLKEPRKIVCKALGKNMGAAHARNMAIEMSTGDFISFLDSDDYWKEDKLPNQVHFMEDKKLDFSFSDFEFLKPNGELIYKSAVNDHIDHDLILHENQFCTPSVILRKSAFNEIRFPNLKRRHDWGLWLLLTKNGKIAVRYPKSTVIVVSRKDSLSLSATRFEKKLPMLLKYRWKIYQLMSVSYIKRLQLIYVFLYKAYKLKFVKLLSILNPFKKTS